MAAPKTTNPGDLTARQRAAAAKKAAADNETRQAELTMATKAEEVRLNETVIDLTGGQAAADEGNEDIPSGDPAEAPEDHTEDNDGATEDEEKEPVSDLTSTSKVVAEQDQIVLKTEKYATVRVNTAIKDMTYGAGNYYTFEVGPKYKVPVVLADYLDSLGYLWH